DGVPPRTPGPETAPRARARAELQSRRSSRRRCGARLEDASPSARSVPTRTLLQPGAPNPLRERTGARDAASQLAVWFGDADPLELVESHVEPVAGKIRSEEHTSELQSR